MGTDDHPAAEPDLNSRDQLRFICLTTDEITDRWFGAWPALTYTRHSAPVQANGTIQTPMFRKPASLIVAVAALALAPVLSTEAVAQSRDQRQQSQERPSPRVSPDEARRRGGEAGGGRPIDTRPRRDGDYSVLVEREGRVREVVVDGQTGRARQGGGDNDNNQRRRPN